MGTQYCEKCNRTMDEKEFYRSNNLEKYPNNGLMNVCKKCLTMHVDNWDPTTFLWILQDIDVPWMPWEWDKLMLKYARDKTKITGLTIIGRYLSKMRLKQNRDYRWKDTEFLQEMQNKKLKETMESQGYGAAEIAKAIDESNTISLKNGDAPLPPPESVLDDVSNNRHLSPTDEDYFDQMNGFSSDDLKIELSDEEKLMYRLKWGKYRPEEWIALERLYNEMMDSYDIQTAAHIDTLKLICKTSLKANQLIDINDVEGYQKMSKVYDSLMKAGKFTAAQTKSESDNDVDSIGELVLLCERDGFIPKYYVSKPEDKADRVLFDLQKYTHDLVTEELSLGSMIESALRRLQEEKEQTAAMDSTEADFDDELFNYEAKPVTDQDLIDYHDQIEQERLEDAEAVSDE